MRNVFATAMLGAACLGAVLATTGTASAAPTASGSPVSCAEVILVDSFAFQPAQVLPGQSSTATLTATNCTGASQTVTETWYGRFLGPSTGIPAGCVAIDPFERSVEFAAHTEVSTATGYLVPTGCTATELAVTVTITGQDGTVLAQPTAYLAIG